jgi:sugar (pentulose or hexulose) kinase
MNSKYAIGVDFWKESGRAVLVDLADGHEVATAVYPYHGQTWKFATGAPAAGTAGACQGGSGEPATG